MAALDEHGLVVCDSRRCVPPADWGRQGVLALVWGAAARGGTGQLVRRYTTDMNCFHSP